MNIILFIIICIIITLIFDYYCKPNNLAKPDNSKVENSKPDNSKPDNVLPSTSKLIDDIHNKSNISLDGNKELPELPHPKPSFDIKDVTTANERPQYNVNNVSANDNVGENDNISNLSNIANQDTNNVDLLNDNTIKSILTNISPDNYMMYDDDYSIDMYFELEPVQITQNKKNKINAPDTIVNNNNTFKLLGVAYNEYYNQYFLLYEHVIKTNNYNNYLEENLNNLRTQVAEYVLAKIRGKSNIEIIHEVGPRNKINYNEVVYFSFGNFQLGPLVVRNV